jgi:2-polyprenyl-6-methoxyphenol hydroxylase-like FAD-dependent oxidoreductase
MDVAETINVAETQVGPCDPPLLPPSTFDVIVVGAGLAGCAAARLFALEGLRVALVEHHRDAHAYKQLCTHFIQASATPVLRRLGLDGLIEGAGGLRNGVDIWTRYGWTGDWPPLDSEGRPAFGYNIQRRTLDPMLRELVAATPGVTFLAGCRVRKLSLDDGHCGVELEGIHPGRFRAHVIVGADGRNSGIAKLADVPAASSVNSRFGVVRAYRNVVWRRGTCSQMWLRGAEAAYVFPNDGAVTVVAYMGTKNKLAEFRADPGGALARSMTAFPDCPDLAAAEPIGETLLIKDYPNLYRKPVSGNVAFIGDALMSIDPLWGVGCGFAFQTAEWLVDALAPALRARQPPAPALKRYAKQVARQLGGHRFLILDYARRRGFNAFERLMFSAAAKDTEYSRQLHAFGARLIGPSSIMSPPALLRAAWINLRRPAAPSAQPGAPV